MSSWKPEVVADNSNKFFSNGLRFATEIEAFEYAVDLSRRWILVRDFRAVPSDEPVNYAFKHGALLPVVLA